jgi:anaerobic selenocysteine-containing dehydrogenase
MDKGIGRREFLAGIGGLGVGLGLGGFSHFFPLPSPEMKPAWSPGREEFVNSTCLLCPSRCGIRGRLVDGKLVRIMGNPLHPVNRGGLCPKGIAGIQLLYHPARITGPIERVGPPGSSEFRRVSWDDALDRIARTLGDLRSRGEAASVAWLAGDVSGVMAGLLRRFGTAIGTPHVLTEDYLDGSAEVMRLSQNIGTPPAFDLAASDMVLSFGAALSEAWWGLPQASRARDAAAGKRPRWVQVDARLSRTAARADEWIAIRPGTYGALALGIAYVLLKEGLYDAQKVNDEVIGLDDFKDDTGQVVPGLRKLVLRHGRTEDVSQRTGIPTEVIVRLAKTFGSMRHPVAVWDQAVSWRTGGLADALAIHALNVLTGAVGRSGGVLVQPPLPVPALDSTLTGAAGPAARPGGSKPAFTAADWAAQVAGGKSPEMKALFLYYANPAASAPNPEEVTKALERVPLVVSFSPFLDETARYAHLVLPDHTYLERWQDAPAPSSVPIPVWGLVQPMLAPLHDTRATGDVILALASRLGGEVAARFPWTKVEELVRQRGEELAAARRGSAFVPSFRREEMRELEARGWWLPHGLSGDDFWTSLRQSGGWFDPYYDYNDRSAASQFRDGKIRLFPAEARKRLASTVPGLEEGFLPLEKAQGTAAPETAYPLRLIPYRVMTLASGGTTLMPWLLETLGVLTGDAWETWAEVNPETGRRLGLSSGQMVRIESEAGSFLARLRTFAGAQPAVVNVPYGLHTAVEGWGSARGSNPLRAVGDRRDPATGLPDWFSARVRVVPA